MTDLASIIKQPCQAFECPECSLLYNSERALMRHNDQSHDSEINVAEIFPTLVWKTVILTEVDPVTRARLSRVLKTKIDRETKKSIKFPVKSGEFHKCPEECVGASHECVGANHEACKFLSRTAGGVRVHLAIIHKHTKEEIQPMIIQQVFIEGTDLTFEQRKDICRGDHDHEIRLKKRDAKRLPLIENS